MIKKPTLALVAIGAGLILNSAVQAASDIPTTSTPSGTTTASPGTNMATPTTGGASSTVNPVSPPASGSATDTTSTSTGTDANATKTDADNKNVNLPPNIADKIKTLNSNSPDFKPNTNTKDQSTSASQ